MTTIVRFLIIFFILSLALFFATYIASYFVSKKYLKNKKSQFTPAEIAFAIAIVIAGFVFVSSFIAVAYGVVSERCNARVAETFHQFNAHLKGLCVEQAGTEACPKTEHELRNFNARAYDGLISCGARAYYGYDQDNRKYTWLVRHPNKFVLISHPEFYPGYGTYSLDPNEKQTPQYPPPFPGPWDKLP